MLYDDTDGFDDMELPEFFCQWQANIDVEVRYCLICTIFEINFELYLVALPPYKYYNSNWQCKIYVATTFVTRNTIVWQQGNLKETMHRASINFVSEPSSEI